MPSTDDITPFRDVTRNDADTTLSAPSVICDVSMILTVLVFGGEIPVAIPSAPGTYRTVLDTDRPEYGGFSRQAAEISHHALPDPIERHFLSLYLPSRAALVLAPEDLAV